MQQAPKAHQIEPLPRREDRPDTYPEGRRCKSCGCYLNRYHAAPAGLCYAHEPGSWQEDGVIIEVAPGVFRRFHLARREKLSDPYELADVIGEAP